MDFGAVMDLLLQYKYFILFPLACVEGPILGFVAGVLVAVGVFDPALALIVLILGDVVPDFAYYFFGRYGRTQALVTKLAPKIGVKPNHFELVRNLWFTHTFKTMAVTKFAYGLSTPLLITAGLVRLPFSRFWQSSVPLSVAQYGVLMALGYFFGGSFALVEDSFVRIQMAAGAAIVVFVAYYLVTSAIRKRFLAEQHEAEEKVEERLS